MSAFLRQTLGFFVQNTYSQQSQARSISRKSADWAFGELTYLDSFWNKLGFWLFSFQYIVVDLLYYELKQPNLSEAKIEVVEN